MLNAKIIKLITKTIKIRQYCWEKFGNFESAEGVYNIAEKFDGQRFYHFYEIIFIDMLNMKQLFYIKGNIIHYTV